MYVPADDFTAVAEVLSSVDRSIQCHPQDGVCYFPRPCSGEAENSHQFIVQVYDLEYSTFDIKLDLDTVYISGSEIGQSSNRCYIPIFKNLHGGQDVWYLGNLFMKNYYSVFDVTPYERNKTDYLHIGLGLKTAAEFVPDYSYNPAKVPRPDQSRDDPSVNPIPEPIPGENDGNDPEGGSAGLLVFLFVLIVGVLIGGGLWYRKKRLQAADEESKSDTELESDVEKADLIDEIGVQLNKDMPKKQPFKPKKEKAIIDQDSSGDNEGIQ